MMMKFIIDCQFCVDIVEFCEEAAAAVSLFAGKSDISQLPSELLISGDSSDSFFERTSTN